MKIMHQKGKKKSKNGQNHENKTHKKLWFFTLAKISPLKVVNNNSINMYFATLIAICQLVSRIAMISILTIPKIFDQFSLRIF